tara:strand:+ start:118 stop:441 length:324 start_codon:yes stop_codon:yes gene_type:complete
MPLSKKEKVEMINDLSEKNKDIIRKAIMNEEMGGSGFWSSLGSGLKDIIIALGPGLIKEVLVPVVKHKVGIKGAGVCLAGNGLKLAGAGSKVAGKRGRGRPKKILEM